MEKHLAAYKQLGLKLTHIPAGTKAPTHKKWGKKPTKYKTLQQHLKSGGNIGLLHSLSNTLCFDIDDIQAALRLFPVLRKLIQGKAGVRYTSGKPNRIKILFKLPSTLRGTFNKIIMPKNIGSIHAGKPGASIQDLLPPSVHPENPNWIYTWKKGIPTTIPPLPKKLSKFLQQEIQLQAGAKDKGRSNHVNTSGYPFIDVYNEWITEQDDNSLMDSILQLGGYTCTGFNTLKRIGSNNKHSVIVYNDGGTERAYNFSDTEGDNLLSHGLHDAYSVLSHKLGFNAAREYVCTHPVMASRVTLLEDTKIADKSGTLGEGKTAGLYRLEGIHFDKKKNSQPYLDIDTMMPRAATGKLNGFGRLVRSITYHQEGVYNPAMAFWYSLCFADYLIGGGYLPYNGNRTEPIYCFTSGLSGDGKTVTMNSGDDHSSNYSSVFQQQKGGDNLQRRTHIKNVATAEGLEDLITTTMQDGCDILFTQDEYGLKENGTMDKSGRAMRAMILDYKTMSRTSRVEPRAKAVQPNKDKQITKSPKSCVHFTYFTTATDNTLKGIISDDEVGQGYIQRFIGGTSRSPYFASRMSKLGKIAPTRFKTDKKLMHVLTKVDKITAATGVLRSSNTDVIRVTIEEDASQYVNNLMELCILSNDPLVKKAVENISPIAKIAAVFENPESPVVTLEMVEWAHTIYSASVLYFKWLLDSLKGTIVEDKDMKTEKAFIRCMEKHFKGNVNATSKQEITLKSNVAKIQAAVGYNKVWDELLKDEVILTVKSKSPAGRSVVRYYFNDEE